MAATDLILTIAIVASLGVGLAWLVGRVADRDKARRAALDPPPAAAATNAPAAAPDAAAGVCPSCRTAYRADLAFCWACGREKTGG